MAFQYVFSRIYVFGYDILGGTWQVSGLSGPIEAGTADVTTSGSFKLRAPVCKACSRIYRRGTCASGIHTVPFCTYRHTINTQFTSPIIHYGSAYIARGAFVYDLAERTSFANWNESSTDPGPKRSCYSLFH